MSDGFKKRDHGAAANKSGSAGALAAMWPGASPDAYSHAASMSMSAKFRRSGQPAALGAAWARKLPDDESTEASRAVRSHLSHVEASVKSRHPTGLKESLEKANGIQYLRALRSVRRCSSAPEIHRHALETALASHMVRARVTLGDWQKMVVDLREARRVGDAGKIRALLDTCNFAEDEPEVRAARDDLERWRQAEETVPGALVDAVEQCDIARVRELVQELNSSGLKTVLGLPEARALLGRYDAQAFGLREDLAAHRIEAVEAALASWEFNEDALVSEARSTVLRYRGDVAELREAVKDERGADYKRLGRAIDAWSFENAEPQELVAAKDLHSRCREVAEELGRLAKQEPLDLQALADAVDAWPFANSQDCCMELAEGRRVLAEQEESVRAARAASDGWALRRLWETSGAERLLAGGEGGSAKVKEVNDLLDRHEAARDILWKRLRDAENLDGGAQPEISRLVEAWEFSQNDPVVELSRGWLHLWQATCARSLAELHAAADVGVSDVARGALQRRQGIVDDDPAIAAAEAVCEACARARQAMGAVAFAVPLDRVPLTLQPDAAASTESAMVERALELINSIQKSDLMEVKSMCQPPFGCQEVLIVVVYLLAGDLQGLPNVPERDPEWRALGSLMGECFLPACKRVAWRIAMGRCAGLERAREAHVRFQASGALDFTVDSMRRKSMACCGLLQFAEHMLAYSRESQRLSQQREAVAATAEHATGREEKAFSPEVNTIGADLDGNPISACTWITCGGDPGKFDQCLEKARAHMVCTHKTLKDLEESLCAMGGESGTPSHGGCQLPPTGVAVSLLKRLERCLSVVHTFSAAGPMGPIMEPIEHLTCHRHPVGENRRTESAAANCRCLLEGACRDIRAAPSMIKAYREGGEPPDFCQISIETGAAPPVQGPTVPLGNLSVAFRTLSSASSDNAIAESVAEFIGAMSSFYCEFLPLRAAWASAAAAAQEADAAVHKMEVMAKTFARFKIVPMVAELPPLRTDMDAGHSAYLAEVEAAVCQVGILTQRGLALPGVHVARASHAADLACAALLQSVPPTPGSSTPGVWLRWTESLIQARLAPLRRFGDTLAGVAESFDCATIAQLVEPSADGGGVPAGEVFQLLMAVICLIQTDEAPQDWNQARPLVADAKGFKASLVAWSHAGVSSVANSSEAKTSLLALWNWYQKLPESEATLRILYAWAALAVSLAPLIATYHGLSPVHTELCTSVQQLQQLDCSTARGANSLEQSEAVAWASARQTLHRENTPWWWLGLVGCESPQDFYVHHGLEADQSSPLALQPAFGNDAECHDAERGLGDMPTSLSRDFAENFDTGGQPIAGLVDVHARGTVRAVPESEGDGRQIRLDEAWSPSLPANIGHDGVDVQNAEGPGDPAPETHLIEGTEGHGQGTGDHNDSGVEPSREDAANLSPSGDIVRAVPAADDQGLKLIERDLVSSVPEDSGGEVGQRGRDPATAVDDGSKPGGRVLVADVADQGATAFSDDGDDLGHARQDAMVAGVDDEVFEPGDMGLLSPTSPTYDDDGFEPIDEPGNTLLKQATYGDDGFEPDPTGLVRATSDASEPGDPGLPRAASDDGNDPCASGLVRAEPAGEPERDDAGLARAATGDVEPGPSYLERANSDDGFERSDAGQIVAASNDYDGQDDMGLVAATSEDEDGFEPDVDDEEDTRAYDSCDFEAAASKQPHRDSDYGFEDDDFEADDEDGEQDVAQEMLKTLNAQRDSAYGFEESEDGYNDE